MACREVSARLRQHDSWPLSDGLRFRGRTPTFTQQLFAGLSEVFRLRRGSAQGHLYWCLGVNCCSILISYLAHPFFRKSDYRAVCRLRTGEQKRPDKMVPVQFSSCFQFVETVTCAPANRTRRPVLADCTVLHVSSKHLTILKASCLE